MDWISIAIVVGTGAYYANVAIRKRRHTAERRRELREFVHAAGFEEIRAWSDENTASGTWRGYAISLLWKRDKPERLIMTIPIAPGPQLRVSPRGGGVIFVFGSPRIEVSYPAAEGLAVRGDTAFADVLFGDDKLVRLLRQNLLSPQDWFQLSERGLEINRRVPDDADLLPVAESQWALARRVIEVFGLSPLAR